MDRQKQLLIEVLLESSWIFRLFLVEALRLFCFLFACLSLILDSFDVLVDIIYLFYFGQG